MIILYFEALCRLFLFSLFCIGYLTKLGNLIRQEKTRVLIRLTVLVLRDCNMYGLFSEQAYSLITSHMRSEQSKMFNLTDILMRTVYTIV